MDERMEAILEHVRAGFRESGSHGLDHTLRVARLCEMLGAEEGADMDVLVPDRSRRGRLPLLGNERLLRQQPS